MPMMKSQSRMPKSCTKVIRSITHADRYGDDKSACEMLFSYGFIDEDASSAKALYLDLEIPEDDPLKRPKRTVSESAPGFHIRQNNGHISWDSDFIWIICVNEEDGLSFKVQQTVSGDTDLVAFWKGDELTDTSKLGTILQQDPHWDLYRLRAVCIMQARVRGQLSLLVDSEVLIQRCLTDPYHTLTYRNQILMGSKRLRTLEGELLNNADSFFESEVSTPLSSKRDLSLSLLYYNENLGTNDGETTCLVDHPPFACERRQRSCICSGYSVFLCTTQCRA